ncbi:winged helix-turn-helix domain-containing protein [Vibrio sp. SCSIO 43136]|uniref:winged helix-turn-helix domain-containing protein n=1 Tax=Vibrio sp. SCSIO 43136 TaxID=2819101 RepID=UPI002075AB97|nr:winged helix-turn-helix domain-containing protein [Vibrio sp. SCSIO 43136]USD65246.1 winged helix-turn-helix domain-containing protein [Vibrio sp. SCSIO 43136]
MEYIYIVNGWRVDTSSGTVVQGQVRHKLSQREIAFLLYLCQRQGEVVPHHEYPDACWPNQEVSNQVVNNMVSKLRRILELSPTSDLESIRNVGYRLSRHCVVADAAPQRPHAEPATTGEADSALPFTEPSTKRLWFRDRYLLLIVLLLLLDAWYLFSFHDESAYSLICSLGAIPC